MADCPSDRDPFPRIPAFTAGLLPLPAQVFGQAAWEHPRLLLTPLVVLVVCLALGIFGVIRVSEQTRSEIRARTRSVAVVKVTELRTSLNAAIVPAQAAASLVEVRWRDVSTINSVFLQQAPHLMNLVPDESVYAISMSPQAVAGALAVAHICGWCMCVLRLSFLLLGCAGRVTCAVQPYA